MIHDKYSASVYVQNILTPSPRSCLDSSSHRDDWLQALPSFPLIERLTSKKIAQSYIEEVIKIRSPIS